jgi:hypothetical protein
MSFADFYVRKVFIELLFVFNDMSISIGQIKIDIEVREAFLILYIYKREL